MKKFQFRVPYCKLSFNSLKEIVKILIGHRVDILLIFNWIARGGEKNGFHIPLTIEPSKKVTYKALT